MSGSIGTILGGAAGFMIGGPAGAAMGASIGGGVDGSRAAGKAVDAQVKSADAATAEQRRQYDLTRSDQAPWMEAGKTSLANIMSGFGNGGEFSKKFTLADYAADPGYQFRLSEGEKGIHRAASARGGLYSGATLKALARYNQDAASNEYGNAYNRFNTDQTGKFNRLASIAGLGQSSVNQVGQSGQNTANRIGENMMGAANARASGYVAGSNALNSGIGNAMNYYQNSQLLSKLAG